MKLISACTYIFLSGEETFPLRRGNFSSQARKLFLSGEETYPIGEETYPYKGGNFSLQGKIIFPTVHKKRDAHSN